MRHACQRYYLGKTKSGQPVFWMIDGMLTPLDAHIGTSAWLSTFLKAREPLIASWQVTHCLFGLHILCHTEITEITERPKGQMEITERAPTSHTQPVPKALSVISEISVCHKKSVCVVESEISAVILSELLPEYVWMAYATTAHLRPELFAPLKGHKVVLFPRTDPTLSNYLFFKDLAALVRQQYEIEIIVDDTLEDHASDEQKERCIDLVDFLFSHG
jgi:hypothetical protein